MDKTNVKGWSYNPDDPPSSINVALFMDGMEGSGTLLGTFPADIYRSDINSEYSISGNHGFLVDLKSIANPTLKNGQSHDIYAYADVSLPGGRPILGDSPKTVSCVPNCDGKQCGSDGCGGSCGTCLRSQNCNADGLCVTPVCNDECAAYGEKQCTSLGYRECGYYDADPCLDWSGTKPCPGFSECILGECREVACSNACNLGEKKCSNPFVARNSFEMCGDSNNDGCTEWSKPIKCSTSQYCLSGSCVSLKTKYSPYGKLESADCSMIVGWAGDKDSTTAQIEVKLYADGPSGIGKYIGTFRADQQGSAAICQKLGGSSSYCKSCPSDKAQCLHKFNITTPESLKDGKAHYIYAYGLNLKATKGSNKLLDGTPKVITCSL